jgi:hypothetical protein
MYQPGRGATIFEVASQFSAAGSVDRGERKPVATELDTLTEDDSGAGLALAGELLVSRYLPTPASPPTNTAVA